MRAPAPMSSKSPGEASVRPGQGVVRAGDPDVPPAFRAPRPRFRTPLAHGFAGTRSLRPQVASPWITPAVVSAARDPCVCRQLVWTCAGRIRRPHQNKTFAVRIAPAAAWMKGRAMLNH